ncbi:AsnC family transcriptional regulator [Saliphagus sp. GCM10025308]
MRNFDETDLEILRLLAEDGRRPFNEVANAVDPRLPLFPTGSASLRNKGSFASLPSTSTAHSYGEASRFSSLFPFVRNALTSSNSSW